MSGTAINLGRVGMPAQLHGSHQRISSLAKEARDVQPGLIKDSTMMRPAVSDRPELATEAHPNPSIPEEDGVRGKAYVHLHPLCKSQDKLGRFYVVGYSQDKIWEFLVY